MLVRLPSARVLEPNALRAARVSVDKCFAVRWECLVVRWRRLFTLHAEVCQVRCTRGTVYIQYLVLHI